MSAAAGVLVAVVALFFHPAFPDFSLAKRHFAGLLLAPLLLAGVAWPAIRRGEIPRPPFAKALFALAVAFAASAFVARDSFAAVEATTSLALLALFGALVRREGSPAFLGIALGAVALVSLYGIAQRLGFDLAWARRIYESRLHPVSTFLNANAATEFAAAGAAVAAGLAVGGNRLGALTAGLGAFCAGATGTRAGGVALGAAAVYLVLRGEKRSTAIATGALVAAAWTAGYALARTVEARTVSERAPAVAPNGRGAPPRGGDGGIAVRLHLASSTARMFLDHPVLGVGAGNFAVAFPPYRDPEEIAISRRAAAPGTESVVETAHADPLQVVAETGIAGLAALAILVVALARAGASASGPSVAAAAGVVAIAANSLVRSPLYENPATALLFFGLLGVLDADRPPTIGGRGARAFGLAMLVLLPVSAHRSLGGLRSQFALARFFAGERVDRALVEKAQRADPRDRLAAVLRARARARSGETAEALALYEGVLAGRPHDFEATLNRGVLLAHAGRFAEAREAFRAAERLDPENRSVRHNLARVAFDTGEDDEALDRLRALVPSDGGAAFREVVLEALRRGEADRALRYAGALRDLRPDDAETARALARALAAVGRTDEARSLLAPVERAEGVRALLAVRAGEALERFRSYREVAAADDPFPWLYLAAASLALAERAEAAALLYELEGKGIPVGDEHLREVGLEPLLADPVLGPLARSLVR